MMDTPQKDFLSSLIFCFLFMYVFIAFPLLNFAHPDRFLTGVHNFVSYMWHIITISITKLTLFDSFVFFVQGILCKPAVVSCPELLWRPCSCPSRYFGNLQKNKKYQLVESIPAVSWKASRQKFVSWQRDSLSIRAAWLGPWAQAHGAHGARAPNIVFTWALVLPGSS